jgi:hypothetical protein
MQPRGTPAVYHLEELTFADARQGKQDAFGQSHCHMRSECCKAPRWAGEGTVMLESGRRLNDQGDRGDRHRVVHLFLGS